MIIFSSVLGLSASASTSFSVLRGPPYGNFLNIFRVDSRLRLSVGRRRQCLGFWTFQIPDAGDSRRRSPREKHSCPGLRLCVNPRTSHCRPLRKRSSSYRCKFPITFSYLTISVRTFTQCGAWPKKCRARCTKGSRITSMKCGSYFDRDDFVFVPHERATSLLCIARHPLHRVQRDRRFERFKAVQTKK